MKRLMVMAGAAMALVCVVSAAGADPRDSVDRGDRLDRDALRDHVRINRLKIPEHPLVIEQPQQPAPVSKKMPKSKKSAVSGQ